MILKAISDVTYSITHVTKWINYTLILGRITFFLDIQMAGIRIHPGSILRNMKDY